jgi:predicted DNA binding protein
LKGSDKKKNKSKKKGTFSKEKDKSTKKLDKSTTKMSNKSDDIIDVDAEVEGEDDDISEFSEAEGYDIDEIKLQVIIEKKDKKTFTSKTIIIKPVEYVNVIEKINDTVQKVLKNKNIKPSNYSLSYKAINVCGLSNALEDKLDFNEFIDDYKKIIAANKKMAVIVVVGDDSVNEKTKSKRSKVKDFFNISIFFIFFMYCI